MKKLVGLVLLVCGLVAYPCLSFADNIYADIVITPSAYTDFFGGIVGGDGDPGPNSIDWAIGNSVPFGGLTDDMVFSTATGDFMIGSNWKERMRITKDGNVGIGTTSPEAKFEIAQTPGTSYIDLTPASNPTGLGTYGEIRFWGDRGKASGRYSAIRGVNTGGLDQNELAFLTAFGGTVSESMRIDDAGNVGIGTTTPSEKLEVNGYVLADGFSTGDIIFRKDDKPVWRMYEDEKGLYVQSLTTDKKYTFVLEEIGDDAGVTEVAAKGVGDKIQQLQEDNKALKARLAKIESLLNARQ